MNMKKSILAVTATALLLAGTSALALAEEAETPSGDLSVALLSKYVWRGYELSKDSAVIQPSITVSYQDVSFNLWGNLDTDVDGDNRHEGQFNETDMTFSYDKSFGMVGLGVGYIYYALDGIDDSQEIYLSVGLDTLLSPSLTVYREIAHTPAWYLSLGISHSIELPKKITLDLAGSVGYYASDDDSFVKVDDNLNPTTDKYNAFHDGLISVGLTIPVGEYFSVVPMIAYSFPLSDDAKNLIRYTNAFSNDSDYVYGGVTVNISF